MVGDIVRVKGLAGRREIIQEGKEDILIKWVDDPDHDKWELFIPKSDITLIL